MYISFTSTYQRHHPDRNNGSAESTEKFKDISEAYTILSDTTKRRTYDLSLKSPSAFNSVSTSSSSYSPNGRRSTGMRDAFQQFDDLFRNDPFFHEAFRDMDDAFAQRFDDGSKENQKQDDISNEKGCVGVGPFCGAMGGLGKETQKNASGKKVSWTQWLMNKLGIELSVTSISHQADGSVLHSAYTSKPSGTYTNKKSRTYVENGKQVTIMSMEKDGNRIEDKLIAGKLVERKVNGKVEQLPGMVKN